MKRSDVFWKRFNLVLIINLCIASNIYLICKYIDNLNETNREMFVLLFCML